MGQLHGAPQLVASSGRAEGSHSCHAGPGYRPRLAVLARDPRERAVQLLARPALTWPVARATGLPPRVTPTALGSAPFGLLCGVAQYVGLAPP